MRTSPYGTLEPMDWIHGADVVGSDGPRGRLKMKDMKNAKCMDARGLIRRNLLGYLKPSECE